MSGRQTRGSQDLNHLSVDQIINLRSRGRGSPLTSRSPSPSHRPARHLVAPITTAGNTSASQPQEGDEETWVDASDQGNMHDQPIPADASLEEVRNIAEQARRETQTMREQQNRMTTALENATKIAAAATAALQALTNANNATPAQTTSVTRRKRPDLPAFDKTNIDIWIKRVEAAYAREDVTDPKQKFAFLESTIGVNMGPTINSFMFGEATQANWEAFIQHLRETYGPTKQKRCSTFLDGLKRDGRRPSDHLALIRDRAKDVTIDDLEKQLVFRGLPQDVQKLLQDKLDGKNALETAQMADQHFDQQGRPLNSETTICSVTENSSFPTTAPHLHAQQLEQSSDVNAVNLRQGQSAPQGNNSQFTPAFGSSNSDNNSQSRSNSRPRQRANRGAPNRSTSRHSSTQAAGATAPPGNEMSHCRLHKDDPNSSTCVGPNCPRHHTATNCWSRKCTSHTGQGNGRGGRH